MITTNKRAVETFIVNKTAQTTMPTSGTVSNSSTLNVNLADGQLGFVSDSIFGTVALNTFVDATPTIAEAPVLAIYQGTPQSASVATATATYPLSVRSYERTASIDGRGDVKVTKQAYRLPSHSVWVVGAEDTNAGEINVAKTTEYSISVGLRGYRVEEHYSYQSAAAVNASVVTPDFTALSKNEKQGRSWIIHNLAWEINKHSKVVRVNSKVPANMPVLALAVSKAGGAGKEIGGVTPLAAGDVVNVVNTASGLKTVTFTEAMATSLKNAALKVQGGVIADLEWTIVPIDLADAYTVSTVETDMLILIGLDESLAYNDRIPQVKTSLKVGLTRGFDYLTVRNVQASFSDEGQGLSRQLDLLYKATHGQKKYSNIHTEDPYVTYPSPIIDGTTYVVYNVMHGELDHIDTSNIILTPKREIICIPSANTTLISSFDTVLNNWLGSSKTNNAIIALN